MKHKHTVLFGLFASTTAAPAALVVSLPGNTTSDSWSNLTNSNTAYTGGNPVAYGTHPGLAAWPSAIAGTGSSAEFNKTSGGGYLGSGSFYDGGTSGALTIDNVGAPLAGLETIVFQVDMGMSTFTTAPSLLVNGSTTLVADLTGVLAGAHSFSFGGPPSATENHVFQWDLRGLGSAVSSYEIQWDTLPHTTIFEMQVDTGDNFVAAIPEPTTGALALLGGLGLIRRKR